MLRPSLPPVRSRTIRLRLTAPCARARSERNAGAAKLTLKAATPFLKKSRRVIAIVVLRYLRWGRPRSALHELVFRRSENQVSQTRSLRLQLRVGPGPRRAGRRVAHEIGVDGAVDLGRDARQQVIHEG